MSIVKSERYSSRYTRGFLRMLTNEGQILTDKFVQQFYTSKSYQERLEAIKYLMSVSGKYEFPVKIFVDALNDFCSQVKVYVLKNFNFTNEDKTEIKACLVNIAKSDEKLQLRTLALETLAKFNDQRYYDLFFSASLLKGTKESAAGLRGLYQIDKGKAYHMAKFRTDSSSGDLDLAISEIFLQEGNIEDLNFITQRLKARNKFNKIELIKIYLKLLGRLEIDDIIRSHVSIIIEDVLASSNRELIQFLILELRQFEAENYLYLTKHAELQGYINKMIDILLERNYQRAIKTGVNVKTN